MKITCKDKIHDPFISTTGEMVYELIRRSDQLGSSRSHSVGYVVIPPGCSSRPHYHPAAEETYYILSGHGRIIVDDKEYLLAPEDTILIMSLEHHQIFSVGDKNLEFIVVCAPAWEPTNSVYLDENKK